MLQLLPIPKCLRREEGAFCLTLESCIVLPAGAGRVLQTAAGQLQEEFGADCGFAPAILCGTARQGDVSLTVQPGLIEDYRLTVTPAGVTVTGRDPEGTLHGVQTLRQIIRQKGWKLPALTVEDAPDFAVRGFYHDQTRGRVAKLEWLMQLADEMCHYKMNQLQLYVEHTYLFRDIPELWAAAGTPLTAQDVMALDSYCADRGIELVPSLASFGHLMELLRTRRFASLCVLEDAAAYPSTMPNRMRHHTVDPEDEAAFPLIAGMIDEYMALFRSDKFNICCDETFDLGRGKHAGGDVKSLYMGFLKKLCAHVAARGKTPMFWGDIVLQHPEALQELPEGAICLNWDYSPNAPEEGVRALSQAGAVQYVCPGVSSWNFWLPRMQAGYDNIRSMAAHARKYGAAGLLNTDWGDFGHISDPRFSLPGMVAGACAAWGELPPMETLWRMLSRLAYGDGTERLVGHLADISAAQENNWWHLVTYMDRMTICPERREAPSLPALSDARLAEIETAVTRAAEGIRDCAPGLAESRRPMIRRWMIAAEAVMLWARVQHRMAAGMKDPDLALGLERFLHRYGQMWREISRESEMWRIRDVTLWYADQLR